MSTAAVEQQLDQDDVDRTLSLTPHEVRTLHVVLGIVMERPGTFGVRGNGSTETRRILIETAGVLRDKLGTPPRAPLAKAAATKPAVVKVKPKTSARPAPVVVTFSAPAAPVLPAPAEPAPAAPAATPAAPVNETKRTGTRHFLVVYSRTKRKPVAEREFDSSEAAFGARATEAAQWSGSDDVETHVISGPNRAVLVSAQPRFFRARPPKQKVGV
jgi:hypothetical protein